MMLAVEPQTLRFTVILTCPAQGIQKLRACSITLHCAGGVSKIWGEGITLQVSQSQVRCAQSLPQALIVMGVWGFDYKTHWVWAKDRIGPGYWNRNKHELFPFGTRGDVPCPAPGEQWDSLLESPRRGHSEKPEIFLEMMEFYFPHLPKIELNRRGPARNGWSAWGLDAEPCLSTRTLEHSSAISA